MGWRVCGQCLLASYSIVGKGDFLMYYTVDDQAFSQSYGLAPFPFPPLSAGCHSFFLINFFIFFFFFFFFFCRARVCRPLLRLCRPFMIFEGCLDPNPEYCRSKLARYRLSQPSLLSLFLSLPVCRPLSLLTREGEGAKSYDGKKAWSCTKIN
jgi:hypothetical protein